jgi:hypothetical protein
MVDVILHFRGVGPQRQRLAAIPAVGCYIFGPGAELRMWRGRGASTRRALDYLLGGVGRGRGEPGGDSYDRGFVRRCKTSSVFLAVVRRSVAIGNPPFVFCGPAQERRRAPG